MGGGYGAVGVSGGPQRVAVGLEMRDRRNRMVNILAGTVFGMLLSISY